MKNRYMYPTVGSLLKEIWWRVHCTRVEISTILITSNTTCTADSLIYNKSQLFGFISTPIDTLDIFICMTYKYVKLHRVKNSKWNCKKILLIRFKLVGHITKIAYHPYPIQFRCFQLLDGGWTPLPPCFLLSFTSLWKPWMTTRPVARKNNCGILPHYV